MFHVGEHVLGRPAEELLERMTGAPLVADVLDEGLHPLALDADLVIGGNERAGEGSPQHQ
jgi:hypothetical protein